MSQDNQNAQPPSSEPNTLKPYQRNQPIWKVTTIQVLRGTIGILETAVVKLETAPPRDAEETPGFWSGILGKIRSLLPANLSDKLSDAALTGIVAAIAVILAVTTTTVLRGKPPEVPTSPPVVAEVPAPTPTPEVTETPTPQPQAEIPPSVTETPETQPQPEIPPSVTETPETQPQEEIPPPPVVETPLPEPEPTPTPTPAVELTPEQILIAAIENQVGEISDRFANGLIKSIQANFRTSNLTVIITDDWYTLEASQQEKLAAEILQRSQQLDFSHLEIIDSQNRLIARSPVVGTEIVIFKRVGNREEGIGNREGEWGIGNRQ